MVLKWDVSVRVSSNHVILIGKKMKRLQIILSSIEIERVEDIFKFLFLFLFYEKKKKEKEKEKKRKKKERKKEKGVS